MRHNNSKINSPLFAFSVTAFETEFFISGLAPLADQLVVLYFVKNSDHMVALVPTPLAVALKWEKNDIVYFDVHACVFAG